MKTGRKLTKLQKQLVDKKVPKSGRVINESVQITNTGDIVPEEGKEFVWIDDLFDDNVKTQKVIYPFTPQALNGVLHGLKEALQGRFIASFLAVGRFIMILSSG